MFYTLCQQTARAGGSNAHAHISERLVPVVAHSTAQRSRRWPRATGQRLSVTKEPQDLFNSFGN